jgi:tetratricopeptide (TPR) repeat protein
MSVSCMYMYAFCYDLNLKFRTFFLNKTMTSAEALKERGNLAMRSGNLAEAVSLYTSALAVDASHVASLSNRALAHLKLGQFNQCISDANAVLELEPRNTKALFRRASAFVELKRPEAATADFVKLLQWEPDNVVAKEQLNQLKWSAKSTARADRLAGRRPVVPVSNSSVVETPAKEEIAAAAQIVQSAMAVDVPEVPDVVEAPDVVRRVAAPAIVLAQPTNADRILSRASPNNAAQYEMFVTELFATALPRAEQLVKLFGALVGWQANVEAFFASEMDDTALELTIEALATHANESNAALCARFDRALRAMPRFDVFTMCIDATTQQRIDRIKSIGNSVN